jgi:CotH kinase protein/Chitobiase/beta-hexosaminidase C-terminal domain/Lamin Tail Domain/Secretion system C-terminal sorting domain
MDRNRLFLSPMKPNHLLHAVLAFLALLPHFGQAQIIINEGCHRNYLSQLDEDLENSDWIELYNSSSESIDLFGYALSDDDDQPSEWVFPHYVLQPGEFLLVFCSEKDRFAAQGFTNAVTNYSFVPEEGWNTHNFDQTLTWDGVSNIIVNTCSYRSAGYTVNSIFNLTDMGYACSSAQFNDGNDASCYADFGNLSNLRPNLQFNGVTISEGTSTLGDTEYPAPYGNWYYSSRHQFLIRADELTAAGLAAGPINSLAFEVVDTDPTEYDYFDIKIALTAITELEAAFVNPFGAQFHTNFKLSSDGETAYLFDPNGNIVSSLLLEGSMPDVTKGAFPDGGNTVVIFGEPTPGASNTNAPDFGIAGTPIASIESGFFTTPQYVSLINPNEAPTEMYFTTDGSEPTMESTLYEGQEINVFTTRIIRARAYKDGMVASPIMTHTYFINVSHTTPIISVVSDETNLYGGSGMFDNPFSDWLKPGYIAYFDSTANHDLLFAQSSGMIMDGGAGGSRGNPQRSFRLKLADGALGENPVALPIIPTKPNRELFSDFYLRNGSNQYLVLPYKDASQVRMMCEGSNNYFSAWRPVTVYVNGEYFGLYELREKFNREKFMIEDGASEESIEILSVSYFYGGVLRAVAGDTQNFYDSYDALIDLDESSPTYWTAADQYFDLDYYTDYICGETWMGNVDWPYNNIKIYRSDATNDRWRFAIQDLELALQPNGWTDCNHQGLFFLDGQGDYPYSSIWLKSIQNETYRNYFINRFADLMNSRYSAERVLAIEQHCFDQTVVEMPNEYQRWGDAGNINGQMDDFYNNHLTFREELECRSETVKAHITEYFNTPALDVTLNVFPAGAGTIKISTLQPDTYPWMGVYYYGIPVRIEAVANEGFTFDHWDANAVLTALENAVFEDLLAEEDLTFNAYFEAIPDAVIEQQAITTIRTYPNPAFDQVIIELEDSQVVSSIEVVDVCGRTIMSFRKNQIQNKMRLETASWANGSYQIVLHGTNGQTAASRLMVGH